MVDRNVSTSVKNTHPGQLVLDWAPPHIHSVVLNISERVRNNTVLILSSLANQNPFGL